MTRAAAGAVALALLAASAGGQEMPGKGLGCWDKQELCHLDCLMPAARLGVAAAAMPLLTITRDQLDECLAGCETTAAACKDTLANAQYLNCATGCATTYDVALQRCNQAVPSTTIGSYGVSMDACANLASGDMDQCMTTCYYGDSSGLDRYGSWSPENEAGRPVTAIPEGQWRRPFKDMDVVYSRNWKMSTANLAAGVSMVGQSTKAQAQPQLMEEALVVDSAAAGVLSASVALSAVLMVLVGAAAASYATKPLRSGGGGARIWRRRRGAHASYGAVDASRSF